MPNNRHLLTTRHYRACLRSSPGTHRIDVAGAGAWGGDVRRPAPGAHGRSTSHHPRGDATSYAQRTWRQRGRAHSMPYRVTRSDDEKPWGLFRRFHEHLATLDVAHLAVHSDAGDLLRCQYRKHLADTRGQRQRDWRRCLWHVVSPMCSAPLHRGVITEAVHHEHTSADCVSQRALR